MTRQEKQLAKLGWTIHPETKYVDLKNAISKINEETKAGDVAFPNPFGKSEIDEIQANHIWQMLKNLAHSGIINIHYLHHSPVYQTDFRIIEPSVVMEFNLYINGLSIWLQHEKNLISLCVKISPNDLEKAISQIQSEIRIATKNQVIIAPTALPLIRAPQSPQSKT